MKFLNYIKYNESLDIVYENDELQEKIDKLLGIKENLHELSARSEVFPQLWGDINPEADKSALDQAKEIYQKAKDMAGSLKRKFLGLLRRVSQFKNSKVLVDIKGMESFVDKIINRGNSASKITDVLRSAILVSSKEEVDKTVDNIKKRFQVAKHKEKKQELDPEYGYFGSHHFYVKVGKMLAEIQVMTKKLWAYKEEAHKIYNKYRSVKQADSEVEKLDKALSKQLFQIANTDKPQLRKKGKPSLTKREKKYKHNLKRGIY